jgi:hypothetical protein
MNTKLLLPIALLLALVPRPSAAARSILERRPASADGRLSVDNVAGRIEIAAWDEPEIEATGELGEDAERFELEVAGDQARARVVLKPGPRNSVGTQLVLHVPRRTRAEVHAVSAEVVLRGLGGPSSIHTVSGDVRFFGARAEVAVQTVSGDIELEGGPERLRATSVSGSIHATGAPLSELELSTVSGDVEISGGAVRSGRARSVSGGLRYSGRLEPGAALELATQSGDVEVRLPLDAAVSVALSSSSGRTENRLAAASGASARLGIRSNSGDIVVRPL